jgi:hypothetical protein
MDLVYILGTGSKNFNLEIRYSLRSVQKHLSNVDQVFIVGENPGFLKDIIHIECEDKGTFKEVNIFYKILQAAIVKDVSEDFLFFNDDHFLNQDFDANNFPVFRKGILQDFIDKRPYAVGGYMTPLRNCQYILKKNGYGEIDFDHHSPITYNKEKIKLLHSRYDWTVPSGYIVKSLYGNTYGLDSVYEPDCKMNQPLPYESMMEIIKNRKIFSVGDAAITDQFKKIMEDLYPQKSRWEE